MQGTVRPLALTQTPRPVPHLNCDSFPPESAGSCCCGTVNINGIRLRNYNKLLREFAKSPGEAGNESRGLLTRFGEHGKVSMRYLSHINNGRKNIGDTLARQLEKGFDKLHGWLDNMDHTTSRQERELSEAEATLHERGTGFLSNDAERRSTGHHLLHE
jgi:hypothetical protein